MANDEKLTDEFVMKAEALRKEGKLQEALMLSLQGLSALPGCLTGRLVLARVFYELGYIPFARREIEELLKADQDSAALKSLAAKFGIHLGEATPQSADREVVVSEADFEFNDLDLVEDKK